MLVSADASGSDVAVAAHGAAEQHARIADALSAHGIVVCRQPEGSAVRPEGSRPWLATVVWLDADANRDEVLALVRETAPAPLFLLTDDPLPSWLAIDGTRLAAVVGLDGVEDVVARMVAFVRGRHIAHPPQPVRTLGPLLTVDRDEATRYADIERLLEVTARSVLITGASGTGKGELARVLHDLGPRPDGPFVEVDCAAIPASLVESTLFGHRRGAFTGAHKDREGLLAAADGGTLFLDEVGELPQLAQAKLLRALESRRFKPVGGADNVELRATVVAATNRDLAILVRRGEFREDLFYRLNVVPIHLQPLRQRRQDVSLLAHRFLWARARGLGRHLVGFTAEAIEALEEHPWPGNIRQLRNVVDRASFFARGPFVEVDDLVPIDDGAPVAEPDAPVVELPPGGLDLHDVERSLVEQALVLSGGNRSQAARLLNVSRYVLLGRVKRFELEI